MEKTNLTAAKRTILGKKVKTLRKTGFLPINVFGKNIKSESLTVPIKEFMAVYKKVRETGLVELKADKDIFHTLITHVQIHPVSRLPLHAQLHAVSLTEKIKAKVPIEFVGESLAVKDGVGILLQTLNEVEVEALPTDLPEKISLDISNLTTVNQQITVGEIATIKGVEVLTIKDEVVVKVVSAVSEETKKEEEAAAAAKAAETPTEAPVGAPSGPAQEPSADAT